MLSFLTGLSVDLTQKQVCFLGILRLTGVLLYSIQICALGSGNLEQHNSRSSCVCTYL